MSQEKLEEVITETEFQISKMEEDIHKLWINVMVPYIESNKSVLSKLSVYDYNKFYKFMIDNNETCIDLNNSLDSLYKMRNKLNPV